MISLSDLNHRVGRGLEDQLIEPPAVQEYTAVPYRDQNLQP